MRAFMDGDFLLTNETAKTLYHEHAAQMPVIDYHCHVSPEEIANDRRYDNIAQAWLSGDHYKWRLMRANGEDERYVSGGGSDHDKFMAFARALPKAPGNPVYHWTHLELRRYFDCELTLSPETAEEIWRHCNQKIGELTVRQIITRSRVEALATTDDPADSLEWHKAIAEDRSFATKVVPAFRPDRAVNIEKPDFAEYLSKLGGAAGIPVTDMDGLLAALENRVNYFDSLGCRASDHGLDYIPYAGDEEQKAPGLLRKALAGGQPLDEDEVEVYKTALLLALGRIYAKRGWVMQLHYGAQRNINTAMSVRPDIGYDAISSRECSQNTAALLDALERTGELPKTILYSLNPNDDAALASICGCFMGGGALCKVQHGGAWWFNDTKPGMEAQLISLASRGMLGGFVGMLTDSRSFLSYTRHEYFRRILCNLLGTWAESGEYPRDIPVLGAMARDISYHNTAGYFRF